MQGHALTVPAPAKLNLFLHVTGRRPDGYHTLESLMVLLNFGDTLTLALREDAEIELTHPLPNVPVESDLTYRAARLLQEYAGVKMGATITVVKRIPLGAGLGGGSSDAASVLLAMNRLWKLEMTRAELMRIGLQLGADVPFFVHGSNAHVAGIGEILRPVTVPRQAYLIAVPPVQVATADIFSAPGLRRDTPNTHANAFPLSFGRNDLQAVAAGLHASIATAITDLDQACIGGTGGTSHTTTRMTGSGSSVFRVADHDSSRPETGPLPGGAVPRADEKSSRRADAQIFGAYGVAESQAGGCRLIHALGIHHHPLREFVAK